MKLTLSSENKFYDRKESSLTKYYRIRSKLTVFFKFLTFYFKKLNKLVNIDLKNLVNWLSTNKISLNVKKTAKYLGEKLMKTFHGNPI